MANPLAALMPSIDQISVTTPSFTGFSKSLSPFTSPAALAASPYGIPSPGPYVLPCMAPPPTLGSTLGLVPLCMRHQLALYPTCTADDCPMAFHAPGDHLHH
ncbi:hypothetical protein GOP47_0005671, partial [Adiantum capillus-veneris]